MADIQTSEACENLHQLMWDREILYADGASKDDNFYETVFV
jgi:hypothetical protein